jgi:predicted benzoate:H+ symporter BenE
VLAPLARASATIRSLNAAVDSAPASSRRYDAALLFACVALILGSIVASFW